MNAPLVERLNLPMVGVHRMVRLASQIVLGAELEYLKESLGYAGTGSWQAYRDEATSGERPTWDDYCKSQAGIAPDAASIYFNCCVEVKNRVREAALPGSGELLALMDRVPSELTNQERQAMLYEIIRLGVNEAETQADIRRAHRKRPARRETRKPAAPELPDSDELLGRNMETLALGAGLSPRTASLVRLVLSAKANLDARPHGTQSLGNSSHE